MATFKIVIFKHHKRIDGKYPVRIRVYWKRQTDKKGSYGFITTGYFVSEKQTNKKPFTVKDPFIINELNARIVKYENLKAQKLGYNIEYYSAKELAAWFEKEGAPGTDTSIDFIEFAKIHCNRLIAKGRKSTADPLRRTVNSLIDFCAGRKVIPINDINVKFLQQYEQYLRGKRTIDRINQLGKVVTTTKQGLSDISVIDYMTDIRTIFNAAIDEYNDFEKDNIRVKHYPFRKYKLKKAPEPEKRVLTADQIRLIKSIPDDKLILDRAILARDVFMLSFYLGGINFADLYGEKSSSFKCGRFSYYRQKTKDRRSDKAYISIKVFPEALELFEKYKDLSGVRVFDFYKRYSSSHIFTSNINIGLKVVAKACDLKTNLSTYYARFSFANIARNDCDVSKDDVNLILVHVDIDKGMKMTDKYLQKDWSKVDNAIRKVIDLINLPISE